MLFIICCFDIIKTIEHFTKKKISIANLMPFEIYRKRDKREECDDLDMVLKNDKEKTIYKSKVFNYSSKGYGIKTKTCIKLGQKLRIVKDCLPIPCQEVIVCWTKLIGNTYHAGLMIVK
ncbi:MAG: hypothetical protein AB1480_13960 [Nitrospirota bacterium]